MFNCAQCAIIFMTCFLILIPIDTATHYYVPVSVSVSVFVSLVQSLYPSQSSATLFPFVCPSNSPEHPHRQLTTSRTVHWTGTGTGFEGVISIGRVRVISFGKRSRCFWLFPGLWYSSLRRLRRRQVQLNSVTQNGNSTSLEYSVPVLTGAAYCGATFNVAVCGPWPSIRRHHIALCRTPRTTFLETCGNLQSLQIKLKLFHKCFTLTDWVL